MLDACPPLHDVNAYAVDDEDDSRRHPTAVPTAPPVPAEAPGDDFWLVATGFTTPSTLMRGTLTRQPAGSAAAGPAGRRAW